MGNLQSNKTKRFKQDLENQLEATPIYPSPDAAIIKTKSRTPTKPTRETAQKIEFHAEPIGKNERVVTGVDGRKPVLDPTKWPNSVHGVIAFKDIEKWGTGALIGPHIVLTAGHNLYDRKIKVYADVKSMQFFPGMNGKLLPFGEIEVEQYFVSLNYIKEGTEDYGILILKTPVGEETGYFGLACLKPEEIQGKKINVTGYPGDKRPENSDNYEMWGMEGEVANIDQKKGVINYLIDTEGGQSGSGVWYQEEEDYYICGVHIIGGLKINTATLLTRAMYRQIHTWLQQARFKELLYNWRLKDSKELTFLNQKMNPECVYLLAKYNLNDLTTLRLSDVRWGDGGVKALAQSNSWMNLSQLYLENNNLGAEGARILAQNTSWINLVTLNLSGNNIGAEGAKGLAQNTSWINLSEINLKRNDINAEGVEALKQNKYWEKSIRIDY